ncbi:hypothetical protein ACHAW5_002178 [Stephanodiscus triporus]|uniref:Spindle assembly checkpoint component MAD1 n=1 Tax=Stephanodiscus triporus TaxID=2934178 RepID=A0ABD3P5S0_9STRA
MQDHRKRPRPQEGENPNQMTVAPSSRSHPPPQSTLSPSSSSSSSSTAAGAAPSSSSPALMLLHTEIRALRTELEHSQSIRSIERRDAAQSEARLKRRLADAYEEASQSRETIDRLRAEVDRHSEVMEGSRREWLERVRWYEERWEMERGDDDDDGGRDAGGRGRCALLQERLDAALDQVRGLEGCLRDAEARRASAEEKATDAARLLRSLETKREGVEAKNDDGEAVVEIPRDLRIRVAETERANRELRRQNESLASRVKDAVQDRERAASCGRKIALLEREVRQLSRQVEEGREATRLWAEFRNDLVEEGGALLSSVAEGEENDDNVAAATTAEREVLSSAAAVVPPEIWTVVRKFRTLKRDARHQEEEIARATQLSEVNSRRCRSLEAQLNEASRSIAKLEETVQEREASISRLEVENRKIIARENIWKKETEGMRSLLDTYERQETTLQQYSTKERATNNVEGLQLGLDSAREEVKLLSKTNAKLVATIDELETEKKSSKDEHDRVLEKFRKLRDALMEERAKAETAAVRAAKAETLAGKGSYNPDTTRVLHLESNPLTDAMQEKFRAEIDSLKRRLEEAEIAAAATSSPSDQKGGDGTTTTTSPDPFNKIRGSLDSATSRDSSNVDAQKLHARLKEQFRNQIALFRQGVYLITGFKIDMSQSQGGGSESDCQIFTVRSIYGANEGDHLMFKWSPKKKSKLDMLNTDMAHLLMKGPCGMYVKDHGSWPGFMASVTLQLFDQQTVL